MLVQIRRRLQRDMISTYENEVSLSCFSLLALSLDCKSIISRVGLIVSSLSRLAFHARTGENPC